MLLHRVELLKEDEKAFPCQQPESDELMPSQRAYDPIEELLFPI
jgi:hypothetical protein